MKTLIIHYTPRGERSNTKKLVDHYKENVKGEVSEINLVTEQPKLFDSASITAYMRRNYGQEKLSEQDNALLAQNDKWISLLKSADTIVLAYPMWNFSVPASVKAFFDQVCFVGETFEYKDGGFNGLLKAEKGLIITTAGGNWSKEPMSSMNHSIPLAKSTLQFLGVKHVDVVAAQGLNQGTPEQTQEEVQRAMIALDSL